MPSEGVGGWRGSPQEAPTQGQANQARGSPRPRPGRHKAQTAWTVQGPVTPLPRQATGAAARLGQAGREGHSLPQASGIQDPPRGFKWVQGREGLHPKEVPLGDQQRGGAGLLAFQREGGPGGPG